MGILSFLGRFKTNKTIVDNNLIIQSINNIKSKQNNTTSNVDDLLLRLKKVTSQGNVITKMTKFFELKDSNGEAVLPILPTDPTEQEKFLKTIGQGICFGLAQMFLMSSFITAIAGLDFLLISTGKSGVLSQIHAMC